MSEKALKKKSGGRVLDFIERAGNKLPHPYILFLSLWSACSAPWEG